MKIKNSARPITTSKYNELEQNEQIKLREIERPKTTTVGTRNRDYKNL